MTNFSERRIHSAKNRRALLMPSRNFRSGWSPTLQITTHHSLLATRHSLFRYSPFAAVWARQEPRPPIFLVPCPVFHVPFNLLGRSLALPFSLSRVPCPLSHSKSVLRFCVINCRLNPIYLDCLPSIVPLVSVCCVGRNSVSKQAWLASDKMSIGGVEADGHLG